MDTSDEAQFASNAKMGSIAGQAQALDAPDVLMAGSDARLHDAMQDIDANGPVPLASSAADDASLKRRHPEIGPDKSTLSNDPQPGESKKVKLDNSKQIAAFVGWESLPPEIWHRIFIFCPPKTLGNLLRVSKLFNLYVDPLSSVKLEKMPHSSPNSVVEPLKPNTIWKESRRLFWPHIPAPLKDKTELEMWRLACSLTCQFCGRNDAWTPLPPLQDGPGNDGVACIWAFRARCCLSCLPSRSVKELEFFMSNVPSFLMPALPFVFSTADYRTVPASFMERGQFPSNMSLSKLFWSADVQGLHQEFLSVKELGASAVEEWQKGLELRGQEHKADAAKWEKFAGSGGLSSMQTTLYPSYQAEVASSEAIKAKQSGLLIDQAPFPAARWPPRAFPSSSQQPAINELVAAYGQPLSLPAKVMVPLRLERTQYDIAELKAIRRADILRRASLLNPPLTEDVLEKMTAFRAAMQIVTPLTDDTWAMLKSRLLEQRAQLAKSNPVELPKATSSQTQAQSRQQPKLQAKFQAQTQTQVQPKSQSQPQPQVQTQAQNSSKSKNGSGNISSNPEKTKAAFEFWDKGQGLLQRKILDYADEAIEDWKSQNNLTASNVGAFAADVLVYVRKRFYEEVRKDAEKARREGRKTVVDPPNGPFTQKLTLDNMKYVFDTKIQHLTGPLGKDIFRCNGCENTSKLYQLQGVLQHYAVKHSRTMSSDSVSIIWNAEWPSTHPFKPSTPPAKRRVVSDFLGSSSKVPAPPQQANNPLARAGAAPAYQALTTRVQPQVLKSQGVLNPDIPPIHNQDWTGLSPHDTPLNEPPPSSHSFAAPTAHGHGTGILLPPHYDSMYLNTRAVMAKAAGELYDAVSGITADLTASVKTFTILFHLNKFYHMTFGHPLPIGVFIDGLLNDQNMQSLQSVGSLSCNACEQQGRQDLEHLTLAALAQHFLLAHISCLSLGHDQDEGGMNWISGMLRFPSVAAMKSLAGRKGQNCHLLREAAQNLLDQNFNGALPKDLSASQPSDVRGQGRRKDTTNGKNMNRDGVKQTENSIPGGGRRLPSGRAATAHLRRAPHAAQARCKTEERDVRDVRNVPHAPLNHEERPDVSSARDMRPPRESGHRSPPRASSRTELSRQASYVERGRERTRQEVPHPPREAGRSASLFADGGGGRGGIPERRSDRSRSPIYGRPAEPVPPPPIMYRNPSPASRYYDHTVGPVHALPENRSMPSYGGTAPVLPIALPPALPPAAASQTRAQQYYRVYVNEEQPVQSVPPAPTVRYSYGAAPNSSRYYEYVPAPPAPMAPIEPPAGSFYAPGPVYGGGQQPPGPVTIRRAAAYYEEYDPRHPAVPGAGSKQVQYQGR